MESPANNGRPLIEIKDFSFAYGDNEVLHDVNLDIAPAIQCATQIKSRRIT